MATRSTPGCAACFIAGAGAGLEPVGLVGPWAAVERAGFGPPLVRVPSTFTTARADAFPAR